MGQNSGFFGDGLVVVSTFQNGVQTDSNGLSPFFAQKNQLYGISYVYPIINCMVYNIVKIPHFAQLLSSYGISYFQTIPYGSNVVESIILTQESVFIAGGIHVKQNGAALFEGPLKCGKAGRNTI